MFSPSLNSPLLLSVGRQAPVTEKGARDYMRVMFAGAHDEVPDKQGRVTIPSGLRTYAGLEKECVVIGANTRLEILGFHFMEHLSRRSRKGFCRCFDGGATRTFLIFRMV